MPFDIQNGLAKTFQSMALFLCLERVFFDYHFPCRRVSSTTKVSSNNRTAQNPEHCEYMSLCFGQFVAMRGACAFLFGAFVILVGVLSVCTGSLCHMFCSYFMNLLACIVPALEKNEKENAAKKALRKGSG